MNDYILNSFDVPIFFGKPLPVNPVFDIFMWIENFFSKYIDEYVDECIDECVDEYDQQYNLKYFETTDINNSKQNLGPTSKLLEFWFNLKYSDKVKIAKECYAYILNSNKDYAQFSDHNSRSELCSYFCFEFVRSRFVNDNYKIVNNKLVILNKNKL
jgi:hypothetical protein